MPDSEPSPPASSTLPTGSRSKAYLDTTVIANALLRGDALGKRCLAAIKGFSHTEMPEYALKEFKAGALLGWLWCHNKFNETRSFADTVSAINKLSSTPRRNLSASARQAFEDAAVADKNEFVSALVIREGVETILDRALADRYRLHLRRRILTAWHRRRAIANEVSMPLQCFIEGDLDQPTDGSLSFDRYSCPKNAKCDVFGALNTRAADIALLMKVVKELPEKAENARRYQALRHIHRTPHRPFSDDLCRSLGDAVFALAAPADSVILTTNIRDHLPLAEALGKKAIEPP